MWITLSRKLLRYLHEIVIIFMGKNIKWDATGMPWGSICKRVSEAEEHLLSDPQISASFL